MAVRWIDTHDLEYEVLDFLGGGAGTVTKERRLADGKIVACKSIDCSAGPDLVNAIASELGDYSPNFDEDYDDDDDDDDIEEDYLVRFTGDYAACAQTSTVKLYMDYYAGGNLQTLLDGLHREGETACPITAATWAMQIASAVRTCHERGIVHGDLAPSNVLLTSDFPWNTLCWALSDGISLTDEQRKQVVRDEDPIKKLYLADNTCFITDRGLSRFSDASNLTATTKPRALTPESKSNTAAFSFKSDVFSLGCLFYTICTGHSPFPDNDFTASYQPISTAYPLKFRQAISECLQLDPDARPTSIALATKLALVYYKEAELLVESLDRIINPTALARHHDAEEELWLAADEEHDYLHHSYGEKLGGIHIVERWLSFDFS